MSDSTAEICTVVGARPQFVKAAVVSRAFREAGLTETIVHTGQHYDEQMSGVFFEELNIPRPEVNLEVGSGPHGRQTGRMMERLEAWLLERSFPEGLLVYGDTNSTLAGALVAAKLNVPLIHVEAGLRSYNREMAEEINRVLVDRVSSLLFCPTPRGVALLAREGIEEGVHYTGDVMRDATRFYAKRAEERVSVEDIAACASGEYYLSTVHRAENTDDEGRLRQIMDALGSLDGPVILPLHPRTRSRMEAWTLSENIRPRAPVSYLEMLVLIRHAQVVLTDSGGVQKEALWLHTPCVTLREETEWPETLDNGWNQVVGTDTAAIERAVGRRPEADGLSDFGAPPRGDSAAQLIVGHIQDSLERRNA
jgi:UDP-GlcNAc3NAcA epimerase